MTELFCIGNAIVDVFAAADFARLDALGITEPVQHIPSPLARQLLEEFGARETTVYSSGGIAANVAKIAAMLHSGAAFAGCVGDASNGDELAAVFENDLRDAGVVPLLVSGTEKTGVCFAFSSAGQAGEIRLAASPGAALEFTAAGVRKDLVAGAKAVVLDGFMLGRLPLVQQVLQLTGRYGVPIALDTASVFQAREYGGEILRYSRSCPMIVFMNAGEAIALYQAITQATAGAAGEPEQEAFILREVCPMLRRAAGSERYPVFVIKLGSRGAIVLAGGETYRAPTSAIEPRNTVGAGDAFAAAFLSAWIRGKPLPECAALGNAVAREILQVPGTRITGDKLLPFAQLPG